MVTKICPRCECEFDTTGPNHKYCSHHCKISTYKDNGKSKEWRDRFNEKAGTLVGIGSGGTTGVGKKNHMFSHGRYAFRNYARKLKNLGVPCAVCGRDLRDCSRGMWVGHHIDHDQTNNDLTNLQMMCKPCHLKHHEIVKTNFAPFWKVQRLSREGVGDTNPEAPDTCFTGDDIV